MVTKSVSIKHRDEMPTVSPVETKTSLRPPLKWAGGKRWLVPHLKPIWASYQDRRLVEPLCGGLAVTLGLMPKRALLNDINSHAINFCRQLKCGLVADLEMRNDSELYYIYRQKFDDLIRKGEWQSPLAGALFYYLNRTGCNGLCRFNRNGEFNVPFGRHKQINYTTDFLPYQPVFEDWEFRLGDFESLSLEPEDFVFSS